MKRKLLLPAAVLLCLVLLSSVLPVRAEETSGRMLTIKNAAYDPEAGVLTVTWTNTGEKAVTGAEIRINPLDADGNSLVIGSGYLEEILLEDRILHTAAVSEPGKDTTVSFAAGAGYPAAVAMDIAFDRFEQAVYTEDGTLAEYTVTELPDDRLCWYSTSGNAYAAGPENAEPYAAPADDVFEQAAGIRIGITTVPVTAELARAYGFARGGLLVAAVEEGSPADHFGLKPWDLIFSVNGLAYEQDLYIMTRAAAELTSGKPVTILLQRDNEFWELALSADE